VATKTAVGAPGVFTQHDVAPILASPLLRKLCENWASLNASPAAGTTVRRWAETHPALDGLGTPGDVVDHIAASDPAAKDQSLRALLALVQDGERLAGEILIQTMLPLLTEMPKSIRSPRGEESYEEMLQRVLAEFWEVIVQPRQLRRPGVAGRLRMDTLHRVTAHRRSRDIWEEHVCYDDERLACRPSAGDPAGSGGPAQLQPILDATRHGELDPGGDLAGLLLWMRDTGEFSRDDARFLGEVYLIAGGDQKAAAQRLGLSHAATRQRLSRLRDRLCAAVAAEVDGRSPELGLAS
jgi:hypothetical protein